MLQHLVFEDVPEARRLSNELLAIASLDGIAHGEVFGDLGLGDGASGVACRSRALADACGSGCGGVCLLVGRHDGCVYLHSVSDVFYCTPATATRAVDASSHYRALQRAMRTARNLHEDLVGVVVVEGEVCLMRRIYVYYLR